MNRYKIITNSKNYIIKANYPKSGAKKFVEKYRKINEPFSVLDVKRNKIHGFYHRNQFIQSGGLLINISNENNIDVHIAKLMERNAHYHIVSIRLDDNYDSYKTFGDKLKSIKNPFHPVVKDYLKNVIFKLQFLHSREEFVDYLTLLNDFKKYHGYMLEVAEFYYPDSYFMNNLFNNLFNANFNANVFIEQFNDDLGKFAYLKNNKANSVRTQPNLGQSSSVQSRSSSSSSSSRNISNTPILTSEQQEVKKTIESYNKMIEKLNEIKKLPTPNLNHVQINEYIDILEAYKIYEFNKIKNNISNKNKTELGIKNKKYLNKNLKIIKNNKYNGSHINVINDFIEKYREKTPEEQRAQQAQQQIIINNLKNLIDNYRETKLYKNINKIKQINTKIRFGNKDILSKLKSKLFNEIVIEIDKIQFKSKFFEQNNVELTTNSLFENNNINNQNKDLIQHLKELYGDNLDDGIIKEKIKDAIKNLYEIGDYNESNYANLDYDRIMNEINQSRRNRNNLPKKANQNNKLQKKISKLEDVLNQDKDEVIMVNHKSEECKIKLNKEEYKFFYYYFLIKERKFDSSKLTDNDYKSLFNYYLDSISYTGNQNIEINKEELKQKLHNLSLSKLYDMFSIMLKKKLSKDSFDIIKGVFKETVNEKELTKEDKRYINDNIIYYNNSLKQILVYISNQKCTDENSVPITLNDIDNILSNLIYKLTSRQFKKISNNEEKKMRMKQMKGMSGLLAGITQKN